MAELEKNSYQNMKILNKSQEKINEELSKFYEINPSI